MIVIEYKFKVKIIQMQITDYISPESIDYYPMWDPKCYRKARKIFKAWLPIREGVKNNCCSLVPKIVPLEHYLPSTGSIDLPKAPYLRRFKSIPQATYQDYAYDIIPQIEWDMLHTLPAFKGYFNYIFELNDFSYFDDLQEELEQKGAQFKDLFLFDIIALELFRRQLGFHDFTGPEKLSYFLDAHPLQGIVNDPFYFPSAADTSYILKLLPADSIMTFFHRLVQEAMALGIIDPRILLWDGQFVRTNCNNNFKDEQAKKAKQYNDPDAGYCQHIGVKKGVGYEASNLYAYCGSWTRVLPVYFKMVPGNRNENPVFRETLGNFLKTPAGKGWLLVILDTGGYSQGSLDFCINKHIFPLIRAKKGLINQPTREMKKGYYFNTKYLPEGWSDADILKTYAIRPAIEAGQASNNTFYNDQRLNTRGIEMATINRALNYILDLLRAITATKLGRIDLMCKLSAFSSTREHMAKQAWIKMARHSSYRPFFLPGLNARQKAFWDRRHKWEERLKAMGKNLKN